MTKGDPSFGDGNPSLSNSPDPVNVVLPCPFLMMYGPLVLLQRLKVQNYHCPYHVVTTTMTYLVRETIHIL